MTAIYGLWRFDGHDPELEFRRVSSALKRYGIHRHERWSPDIAIRLGRHLHISVPEDRLRTSADPEARYVVAGDVRLTERDDLTRQLNLGAEASQMPDAAIVALALESWHEQAFDRIYGAFAIAAWDCVEARLLLARDHLGHKPLFFHRNSAFFAFASMPVGLHALPEVPRAPDIESMKRFLALQNPSPGKSHYEGIERLNPGHYAIVTAQGLEEYLYWKPDLTPLRLGTNDEYARALADHLDRAVKASLRGVDRQVGAHLSSGFDSTAVATTAARQLLPRGASVIAYTAAPREGYVKTLEGRTADESILAAATAALHPNMKHAVVRTDRTPMANLSRTASIYGLPVMNICNETWFDAINDNAADRGITIMLESLAGNATLSERGVAALPELLRSGRIFAWSRLVLALRRKGQMNWISILLNSFRQWLPNGVYRRLLDLRHRSLVLGSRWSSLKDDYRRAAIMDAATELPVLGAADRVLGNEWSRASDDSLTDRLTLLSTDDSGAACKGILAEWRIDYRDPTADRRLVEFSLRVPAEQLIFDGQPRALLRKVLADRAPPEVLDNPKKGYQAADWHEGLNEARDEVAEEVARIEMFEPSAEIIDVDRLRSLIDDWPEAGSEAWTQFAAVVDYRCRLLRAISAASFMRQASGSNY